MNYVLWNAAADATQMHRRQCPPISTFLSLLLLFGAIIGCGQQSGRGCAVSGRVTFNGQPLPEGLIMFMPLAPSREHRTVSAVITNGEFVVPANKSLLPGSYRVAVTAEKTTGRKKPAGEGLSGLVDEYQQYIPAMYNARTTLSVEITGDTDTLEFPLESTSAQRRR